jgi:hypothetical protein
MPYESGNGLQIIPQDRRALVFSFQLRLRLRRHCCVHADVFVAGAEVYVTDYYHLHPFGKQEGDDMQHCKEFCVVWISLDEAPLRSEVQR